MVDRINRENLIVGIDLIPCKVRCIESSQPWNFVSELGLYLARRDNLAHSSEGIFSPIYLRRREFTECTALIDNPYRDGKNLGDTIINSYPLNWFEMGFNKDSLHLRLTDIDPKIEINKGTPIIEDKEVNLIVYERLTPEEKFNFLRGFNESFLKGRKW